MTISINHLTPIAEHTNLWDDFLPEGHHLKTRHLLPLENAQVPDIENNYVQVFHKDKLIGLVYLQLFKFAHSNLNFDNPSGLQCRAIKFILPKKLYLLICGNLFRINFQGFYFKNEQHNAFIFDAIELFLQQNRKLKPRGIIIKDCKEVFVEEKYAASKYHFFNGDVTMEITRRPHWNTFEDYLNDLTKKYVKRAKKIMQAFESVVTKELSAAEILDNASAIDQLYWHVVNKQQVRLGTVNAAYLYELKRDLEHRFELHALYLNDVMIGFYTYIFYTNEMETRYIGLDYSYNDTHKTYFNILFLSVQKMIEGKYEKLELGRTAKEAKANLGAFPKQIFNYVKVKNTFAKIALRYFLNRFNRSENQKQLERSPLK
ncbi:MAG: hypothetical protein IPF72_00895 [Chitinophagaceae bacterium]|nr:hypothetical protein [Chitinophagaceae bacterium]